MNTISRPIPGNRQTTPVPASAFLAFGALASSMFIYAFIADLMGPMGDIAHTIAIVMTGVISMIGATICLLREKYFSALTSIIGIAVVWIYIFVFAYYSGQNFIWSSGGEYIGLSMFSLFSLVIDDRAFGRLMRWFYLLCCGYAIFYVAATYALREGLLDITDVSRIVAGADDAGRGARLQPAAAAIVFGLAYSLTNLVRRMSIPYLLAALLFAFVWILTGSRAISWVLFVVMAGYLAIRNVRLLGRLGFGGFVVGTVVSFALLRWPDLNPFYYFSDQSASARVASIDIARWSMSDYWLTGAGISFGEDGYKPLTGTKFFYPGDIGMIGTLYSYGVLGVALYAVICWAACRSNRFVSQLGYDRMLAESVGLTGIVLALYSLQAPLFNGGSSGSPFATMFGALAFAAHKLRSSSGARAATASDVRSGRPGLLARRFRPGDRRLPPPQLSN